jgi:hypothetical protein
VPLENPHLLHTQVSITLMNLPLTYNGHTKHRAFEADVNHKYRSPWSCSA